MNEFRAERARLWERRPPRSARHGPFLLIAWLVVFAACAPLPPSPTLDAVNAIRVRQGSGQFGPFEWTIAGSSHAAYLARLESWATARDFTIVYADLQRKLLAGHVGYEGDRMGWVIFLNREEPTNMQYYTLIHELAHAFGPDLATVPESEAFAEFTAMQVCHHVGLETGRETAAYLHAKVPDDVQWRIAVRHGMKIDALVRKLTAASL